MTPFQQILLILIEGDGVGFCLIQQFFLPLPVPLDGGGTQLRDDLCALPVGDQHVGGVLVKDLERVSGLFEGLMEAKLFHAGPADGVGLID